MNVKLIVGVVLVALLASLVYFSYSQTGKLAVEMGKNKDLTIQLESLAASKAKSDEAVAQLTIDTNKQQAIVTRTITKIVKVPVSVEEKCMSNVLKESLKEETK